MKRHLHRIGFAAFLAAGFGLPPAQANDSAFGGSGSDLIPLTETTIRMASEEILFTAASPLSFKGDWGEWEVEARYRFENPSQRAVRLTMGFPETRCGDDDWSGDGSPHCGEFRGLRTEVRGVPVEMHAGKVGKPPWSERLGRVYLFEVSFKPRETIEIVHKYRYDRTPGSGYESLTYVTATGALWNGPIGSARFRLIGLEIPPRAVQYPPSFHLAESVERPTPAGGRTDLTFETRDWRPTGDFSLTLINDYWPSRFNCPLLENIEADDPDWRALDAKALRLCRNLPFAAHGKAFEDRDLAEQFYRPEGLSEDDEAVKAVDFRPNALYADSLLTAAEWAYVERAKQEEALRAGAKI
jgi:hypothetical protein